MLGNLVPLKSRLGARPTRAPTTIEVTMPDSNKLRCVDRELQRTQYLVFFAAKSERGRSTACLSDAPHAAFSGKW